MPPVSFSVIPAVSRLKTCRDKLKPESRPAPNKGIRMMDSGKELAGMTACELSDKLLV